MFNHRLRLWHNILDDLGPDEGCMMPWWLIAVYCVLFPFGGWKWLFFERTGPLDIYRMVWTIYGQEYSDEFFRRMAIADGTVLKVERIDGRVTLTKYNLQPQQ